MFRIQCRSVSGRLTGWPAGRHWLCMPVIRREEQWWGSPNVTQTLQRSGRGHQVSWLQSGGVKKMPDPAFLINRWHFYGLISLHVEKKKRFDLLRTISIFKLLNFYVSVAALHYKKKNTSLPLNGKQLMSLSLFSAITFLLYYFTFGRRNDSRSQMEEEGDKEVRVCVCVHVWRRRCLVCARQKCLITHS